MAKSTYYLYDLDPKLLINLSYVEATNLKIDSAKKLIKVLFEPSYMDRDNTRINEIDKGLGKTPLKHFGEVLFQNILHLIPLPVYKYQCSHLDR